MKLVDNLPIFALSRNNARVFDGYFLGIWYYQPWHFIAVKLIIFILRVVVKEKGWSLQFATILIKIWPWNSKPHPPLMLIAISFRPKYPLQYIEFFIFVKIKQKISVLNKLKSNYICSFLSIGFIKKYFFNKNQ